MMILLPLLKKFFDSRNETSRFVIAYSGGLDSHVLLHAASHGCNKVIAVHVNHQLNKHSNAWATHCQQTCADLNVDCHIETVALNLKPGDSVEEKARLMRYAALVKYIDKNSVLLTAHTLNDQAETFLLQALRGAGPKGLSAMPIQKKFGQGILYRPLLTCSRDEISAYATKHKLQWIEDESNQDTRFNRNFLRHTIFPALKARWPAVHENLARSAQLMGEYEKVISEIGEQDYQAIFQKQCECVCECDHGASLYLDPLLQLSDLRQRLVLREWLRIHQQRMPSKKQLAQIQKDVLGAQRDANPVFCLENSVIRRSREYLYLTNSE